MSGADLENITNESAYICISRKKAVIVDQDLIDAYEKVY